MNELISVIIPVYNVEQYLDRCIKSIVSQDYPNLEIILVDDGSIDKSGSICDHWSHVNSRITVIHKVNGGLSSARNAGIDNMHGNYVMFVDSDDYLLPNCISFLKNMISDDCEVAIGNYVCTDQDTVSEPCISDKYKQKSISGYDALELLFSKDTVQAVTAWGKLYRSSLFSKIRYAEGLLHEDEATTYKIYANCKKLIISDRPVYAYFKNEKSISRKPNPKNFTDLEKILKEQTAFFQESGHPELANKVRVRCCLNIATHYFPKDYFCNHTIMVQKARESFKAISSVSDVGVSSYLKAFSCSYLTLIIARILRRY